MSSERNEESGVEREIRDLVELIEMPGFQLILKHYDQITAAAQVQLLTSTSMSIEEIRYEQGKLWATKQLSELINNALEQAGIIGIET